MQPWEYVLIGIGIWVLVAAVLAFVLARILGRIGREVTALHEFLDSEAWATRPLSHAPDHEGEPQREDEPQRARSAMQPARRDRTERRL
jgi:hypothetical protein